MGYGSNPYPFPKKIGGWFLQVQQQKLKSMDFMEIQAGIKTGVQWDLRTRKVLRKMKWQQPFSDENDGSSVEMLPQLSLLGYFVGDKNRFLIEIFVSNQILVGKFNLLTSASIYSGARVIHSGLTRVMRHKHNINEDYISTMGTHWSVFLLHK